MAVSADSRAETGRTEHRMDVSLTGRLEPLGPRAAGERIMIRNLSSHGARVISGRPWQENDHVNLSETVGNYHLDAQVVYCERLADNRYAVGLKFEPDAASHAGTTSHSYW
ncbi:MAG TPA: PilZ domain-containing protein [Steroidobacteraceae bacterium]|nr:PilZ domain-containing protein [Steroidobacteraceae bacterium]